jgi:hypothetical protein
LKLKWNGNKLINKKRQQFALALFGEVNKDRKQISYNYSLAFSALAGLVAGQATPSQLAFKAFCSSLTASTAFNFALPLI